MQPKGPAKRISEYLIEDALMRDGGSPERERVGHLWDENDFDKIDGNYWKRWAVSMVDTSDEVGCNTSLCSNCIELAVPSTVGLRVQP
jgi:hypothetical protein